MRVLLLRVSVLFAAAGLASFFLQQWFTSLVTASVYLVFFSSVSIILVAVDGFTAAELNGVSLGHQMFRPDVRERFANQASHLREGLLIDGAILAILAAAGYSFASSVDSIDSPSSIRTLNAVIAGTAFVVADMGIRVLVRLSDVKRFAVDARRAVSEQESAARRIVTIDALRVGLDASEHHSTPFRSSSSLP